MRLLSVYTGRNSLGRRRRLPHPAATVTARRLRAGFLTSLPELAALAALPRDIAVPGLQRARAKSSPAPVTVPGGGRHLKLFGTAEVGGQPIAMTAADARYHMHVVGSTGSGKSTLLTNLILDDIEAGRGTVVIDPHGDLILDILERLDPDDVKNRLVLFDPDQPNPPRLNPLEGDPEDQDLIVDNLVGIFSSIFQKAWGPRMDDVMRVSCLTVMRQEQASMQMIPRLLNEDVFRASATQNLSDKAGLTDFWEWYSTLNPAMRSQVIGPVQARLRAFLLRDFVQQTMSASTSSFDMADVLDGGILLARLPKGTLGLETSRLMGSMLLAKVWQAASARAALPPGQRKDCSIYLDEAQNFLTMGAGVADMLAEARKYRLSMVLAHQNLGQFPRELLQAVAANARSKVFFSCSPGDASQLEEHTLPELDAHDLSHLDAYTAAARLMADGQQTAAFTLRTRPPRPEVGQLDRIREDAAAATPQPGHAEVNEMTDRLHDELDNGKKGRPPRPRQQRPKGTKPDNGPQSDDGSEPA